MTFITKTLEVGRRAANILELDLDGCENSYGISPCDATLALTNNLEESQTLDDTGAWSFAAAAVTANDINAPDGTLTADKLIATTVTSIQKFHLQDTAPPVIPTFLLTYTFSEFFKADEIQYVQLLYTEALIPTCFANFDILNGIFIDGGNITNTYFVAAKEIRNARRTRRATCRIGHSRCRRPCSAREHRRPHASHSKD